MDDDLKIEFLSSNLQERFEDSLLLTNKDYKKIATTFIKKGGYEDDKDIEFNVNKAITFMAVRISLNK